MFYFLRFLLMANLSRMNIGLEFFIFNYIEIRVQIPILLGALKGLARGSISGGG